jgi:hypothetical protein
VGLQAFEYRNGTLLAPVAALDERIYRLRRAGDAAWPPRARAYGGPVESLWTHLVRPLAAAGRLVLPVLLRAALLVAAHRYSGAFLPLGDASAALPGIAVTDLLIPAAWYAVHLVSRRYGASYAFAQLVAGLLLAGMIVTVPGVRHAIAAAPPASPRTLLAFGGAFFLANLIAIAFFDGARGPRWWTAPLLASLAASLTFSAVYYPFAGEAAWADCALVHLCLFLSESVLLLAPYWLLRPALPPRHGLNGY